ncbi:MAG: DUF1194 domain-containing protein [Pseudomonadota bacterium]
MAGLLIGPAAEAACRQALALGLDVSGSVDLQEYRLQIDGLVSALNDPEVRDKLLARPSAPVHLMVYEWSGSADQSILVPWTAITDERTLKAISRTLAQTERREAAPGTALGLAMQKGADFLDQKRDCWKRTLDISGDGKSNLGPQPEHVKPRMDRDGITVNALVIGSDSPASGDRRQTEISELSSYFRTEVIAGPDAFVQTALGFADYAAAMTLKLKKELDGLVIGARQ